MSKDRKPMIQFHGLNSLAVKYANINNVSVNEAKESIKKVLDVIEEGLLDPTLHGVQFIDYFTIKRVVRKAKLGRDLRTYEPIAIPERIDLKAECSKKLKEKLNK